MFDILPQHLITIRSIINHFFFRKLQLLTVHLAHKQQKKINNNFRITEKRMKINNLK